MSCCGCCCYVFCCLCSSGYCCMYCGYCCCCVYSDAVGFQPAALRCFHTFPKGSEAGLRVGGNSSIPGIAVVDLLFSAGFMYSLDSVIFRYAGHSTIFSGCGPPQLAHTAASFLASCTRVLDVPRRTSNICNEPGSWWLRAPSPGIYDTVSRI